MRTKIDIQFANNLARLNNGQCLSDVCENAHSKLKWKCICGNEWETTLWSIRQGSWCRICSDIKRTNNKRLGIDVAKELAKSRGGECLSDIYIDAHSALKWKCEKGHEWETCYNDVKYGTWCRVCHIKKCSLNLAKGYKKVHWKTGEILFCRGSWEGVVIDYFNYNRIDYDWQIPFRMSKRHIYIVDLYDKQRNIYIEIKGYKRPKGMKKWRWFHKKYSNSELWDEKKLKEIGLL